MRYVLAVLLLAGSVSISHGYDMARISKADLTGIWFTKNSILWLYEDRSMKLYNKVTCALKATGKWKFEFGGLHMYVDGKEVFWRQVLEVPKTGNRNMRFADNSTWWFFHKNTDRKCD